MAKLETRIKKILGKFLEKKLNKKFYIFYKELVQDLESNTIQNIQKYRIKLKCKKCGGISYRKIEILRENTSCDNCKKRWDYERFILKAKEINQTDNFKYLFNKKWWNKNYKNRKTKIKLQCKNCGKILEQSVDGHLKGHGCKFCAKNQKMEFEVFLEKAKKFKNQILITEDWWNKNYKNEKTLIPIFCNKHGNFYLTASQIKLNKQCPKCSDTKLTLESFLKTTFEKHKNKYDYSLITEDWWNKNYKNSRTKIPIICPKHGIFEQPVMNHIFEGNGCPVCSGSNNESIIKNYLDSLNLNYIHHYKFKYNNKDYIFDFYIPQLKLLIEVDGEQHFKPVDFAGKGHEWARANFRKIKKSDFIKNKIAFIENLKLARIPYKELNEYII